MLLSRREPFSILTPRRCHARRNNETEGWGFSYIEPAHCDISGAAGTGDGSATRSGAAFLSLASNPILDHCNIHENPAAGEAVRIYATVDPEELWPCPSRVSHCRIHHNTGGGLAFYGLDNTLARNANQKTR